MRVSEMKEVALAPVFSLECYEKHLFIEGLKVTVNVDTFLLTN